MLTSFQIQYLVKLPAAWAELYLISGSFSTKNYFSSQQDVPYKISLHKTWWFYLFLFSDFLITVEWASWGEVFCII